jgi:hypothetical protein
MRKVTLHAEPPAWDQCDFAAEVLGSVDLGQENLDTPSTRRPAPQSTSARPLQPKRTHSRSTRPHPADNSENLDRASHEVLDQARYTPETIGRDFPGPLLKPSRGNSVHGASLI